MHKIEKEKEPGYHYVQFKILKTFKQQKLLFSDKYQSLKIVEMYSLQFQRNIFFILDMSK